MSTPPKSLDVRDRPNTYYIIKVKAGVRAPMCRENVLLAMFIDNEWWPTFIHDPISSNNVSHWSEINEPSK